MPELKSIPAQINSQTLKELEEYKKENDILKLSDSGIERAVLACIIIESSKIIEASTKLVPEDFVNLNNRYLYEILLSIFKKSNGQKLVFDLSTLISRAEEKGLKDKFLQKLGGQEYIEYLTIIKNSMVDVTNFDSYLGRLLELSTKRKFYHNVDDFKKQILESDISIDELIIRERNTLDKILIDSNSKDLQINNISDGAEVFVREALKQKKELIGFSTGFTRLDTKIEGLKRGALSVVCAAKKTGKTAFIVNIGVNVGIKKSIPTLMISTEMSDDEIRWRILSNLSGVQANKIIKGYLNETESQKVFAAVKQLESGNFYHITMRNFTLEKLNGIIRKFTSQVVGVNYEGQVRDCLVLFDYIKMPQADLNSSKDFKEHKLLGLLTDGLKMIAGDLQIPVLTACQTNRAGDVASSYEITWFCDTFMELTKKSQKEIDRDANLGGYRGNQRLKITANRGGEEDHEGIDFDYSGTTLTYQELNTSTNF